MRLQKHDTPIPYHVLERFLGRGTMGEVWLARGPGGVHKAMKFVRLENLQGVKELMAVERINAAGGVNGKHLDEDDRETIAGLPEKLGWKRTGMTCDGELLILLDHQARWGDTADLLMRCAYAGIWQLAFVAQKNRKTRFKIPAHLPTDRGL